MPPPTLAPRLLLSILLCAPAARAGDILVTVTDHKGKPIDEAVVYLYDAPGRHKGPSKPLIMDQIDKMFVPHVLVALVGSKVRFPNKDNIHHHVYSFSKPKKFDLPLYKGEPTAPVLMDKPGVVKMGCNIHDWMQGFIVVLPNPYYAQTGKDGTARITGAPAGKYKLALWSDRLKDPVEDTLQAVAVEKKGTVAASFKRKFKARYVAHQHPVQGY